jgi:demethylmenaquinone methyltransferase/2-methoxy-6-polyprenyl-1,4-benzoquinol methylase
MPEAPPRDLRGKAHTQAAYDRLSGWYDWLSGPAERRYSRLGMELLAVQPGETVLEIGFGTGHALSDLARFCGADGLALGLDLSPGMARQAARRLKHTILPARPAVLVGDGEFIPLTPASLDAIFISFTLDLMHLPLIFSVLAECRRALRLTGRLGVVALGLPATPSRVTEFYLALHQRFPDLLDCRPIPAAAWLANCGFEVRSCLTPNLMGFLPLEIILAVPRPAAEPAAPTFRNPGQVETPA